MIIFQVLFFLNYFVSDLRINTGHKKDFSFKSQFCQLHRDVKSENGGVAAEI